MVKQVNTITPIKEHKKYSYKLQGLDISHAIKFGVQTSPTSRFHEILLDYKKLMSAYQESIKLNKEKKGIV
ncbi:MAG: hypothetical protein HOB13_12175 [Lentimicrobiaceae bacterium]|nr:hypothetical protein [Lentimicrobiaceae bacterium]